MSDSPIIRVPVGNFIVQGDPANVELVSIGPNFPRDKTDLELFVTKQFAKHVVAKKGITWTGLHSIPSGQDPPDVAGTCEGETVGIEVGGEPMTFTLWHGSSERLRICLSSSDQGFRGKLLASSSWTPSP